jgi:hypothetical protein
MMLSFFFRDRTNMLDSFAGGTSKRPANLRSESSRRLSHLPPGPTIVALQGDERP